MGGNAFNINALAMAYARAKENEADTPEDKESSKTSEKSASIMSDNQLQNLMIGQMFLEGGSRAAYRNRCCNNIWSFNSMPRFGMGQNYGFETFGMGGYGMDITNMPIGMMPYERYAPSSGYGLNTCGLNIGSFDYMPMGGGLNTCGMNIGGFNYSSGGNFFGGRSKGSFWGGLSSLVQTGLGIFFSGKGLGLFGKKNA